VIHIADFPEIVVEIKREGCCLSLPPTNGFFCSFDKTPPKTKELLLQLLFQYSQKRSFSFPIPLGTPFQMKVWQELSKIPFGQSLNYRKVATQLGMQNGARAVGGACGRNPMPLFIPCHRVIAANGGIGGFSYALEVKKRLLIFERIACLKSHPFRDDCKTRFESQSGGSRQAIPGVVQKSDYVQEAP
jgi:methylated-DNA-[protein]-cysteine S-methyltransferase